MGERSQIRRTRGGHSQQAALYTRRSGIFKRARELHPLHSVEAAIVILSISGMASSSFDDATIYEVEKRNYNYCEQSEAKKNVNEIVQQMTLENMSQSVMHKPVDDLTLEELGTLKTMIEEFEAKLRKRAQELLIDPAAQTAATANEPDVGMNCFPADHECN